MCSQAVESVGRSWSVFVRALSNPQCGKRGQNTRHLDIEHNSNLVGELTLFIKLIHFPKFIIRHFGNASVICVSCDFLLRQRELPSVCVYSICLPLCVAVGDDANENSLLVEGKAFPKNLLN